MQMEDALHDLDLDPPDPLWKRILMVWVAPLLAFIVLFFAIGWLRAPSLPAQAPAFSLHTVEGETIELEQFRGRTVVLNFWATWCGPCKLEAPSFAAFATNNPDIVVLGMAEDSDPNKVRRAGRSLGLTYPLVMTDRKTLKAYGINSFPTTVIVGPDGAIRHAHAGMLFRPQLWALLQL